jgi:hypothetical protein
MQRRAPSGCVAAQDLLRAREQLRVCAAAACPAVVQSDCANWLEEVERALATVVVTAKNAAGSDLFDVKVAIDGQSFLSRLDGMAAPMNAGAHAFHFELASGESRDLQVMIKEGAKNQAVAIILGSTPPSPSAPQVAPQPVDSASTASSPLTTLRWILAGVGLAVSGFVALGDKNGAHCEFQQRLRPRQHGRNQEHGARFGHWVDRWRRLARKWPRPHDLLAEGEP